MSCLTMAVMSGLRLGLSLGFNKESPSDASSVPSTSDGLQWVRRCERPESAMLKTSCVPALPKGSYQETRCFDWDDARNPPLQAGADLCADVHNEIRQVGDPAQSWRRLPAIMLSFVSGYRAQSRTVELTASIRG